MIRRTALVAAVTLAACADLTESEGGVGSLTVFVPSPAEIEVDQTVQLQAVARSGSGDTLDLPVVWLGLDSTLAVDSTSGRITGRFSGSGRLVARAADFYSDIVTFTVLARVDTVIRVGADTQTVAAADSLSTELTVRLEGGSPAAPVGGRRIVYDIVSPVFADTAARTVEFQSGGLQARPSSASTGSPQPAPVLRRIAGRTAPDSAVVVVNVYRPAGGGAVPGSGQQFIVRFATP
ncbi:MAG TPA: hypothetical protein VF862_05115 [Gemmatimonadales bacterium]